MVKFENVPKTQDYILFDRNLTDLLRFVACLMVAMSHYAGYALVNGMGNPIYSIVAANGGYIGVALFFLLSGYGLMMSDMKKHLGVVGFLRRRLSKTYLPAVLASIIWLIINLVIDTTGGGNLLCNQQYVLGVIWRFNDEVMWFVNTIIVLYLFFYAFRFTGTSKYSYNSKYIEPIVLLLLGAIATALVRWIGIGDPISVPLFFAGVAIARWQKTARFIFTNWWCLLLVVMIIMSVTYIGRTDNRVLHGVVNYFCMVGLVALLAFFNIRISSLPKWVGGCSYDFYLVHYKVHLLLVFLFGVDHLWMFAIGTVVATLGFYNLRKLCKL